MTPSGPHIMTKPDATREILERAYLAGFAASGEGWNGEYPFADFGKNPQDDPYWVEVRDKFLAEIEEQSS